MRLKLWNAVPVFILTILCAVPMAYALGNAEDDLAATIQRVLGKSFDTEWGGLESIPNSKWAPLPPKMLQNCLPDGGCFTRQGMMMIGGRNLTVLATGARSMVSNLYFPNPASPIGEDAVLAALKRDGFVTELARCPMPGSAGGKNWYRLKSARTNPGVLAIQSSCNGKPCETFVLSQGADLPQLQPTQLRSYSEQCTGAPATRKPAATVMPQEALAQTIAAYLPPATGPAFYGWSALPAKLPNAEWIPGGAKKTDLSFKNDANPYSISGNMTLSGRAFSLLASGSPTDVRAIYLDENGMHPSGENVMGALYSLGYAIKLVRCGPVYTESTNNWYSITGAKAHPAMIQQSIRYEGKRVQDAYALRLDGMLPKRDPRDRDPGVNGCR